MSGGRPTTYTPERAEEAKSLILKHFAKGQGLAAVAVELGVARSTIYKWCDEDPALSDTLGIGKDASLAFWETHMTNAAIDGTGNAPLFKFLVTNKHRDDYQGRQEVKVDGTLQVMEIDFSGFEDDDGDSEED